MVCVEPFDVPRTVATGASTDPQRAPATDAVTTRAWGTPTAPLACTPASVTFALAAAAGEAVARPKPARIITTDASAPTILVKRERVQPNVDAVMILPRLRWLEGSRGSAQES